MNLALALSLVLAAPAAAPGKGLTVTGEPDAVPVELTGPAELEALCGALEPAERLRPAGDAVARAEAEDAHEERRELVTVARYRVVLPAGKLAFAPYARAERRLALKDAVLPLSRDARLFTALEAGLPVEVPAEVARRILEQQRGGQLELELLFDLADDTSCSRGRPRTLPVEPVTWSWRAGAEPLARGGAGADRTTLSARAGARAKVTVGAPLAGPEHAREAVAARQGALSGCYAEALGRAPSLDGVLVAELAPGQAEARVTGDAVGDPALAECVRRALAGVAVGGGSATVPIRFELEE